MRSRGMIYKAVDQAVLLYVSESWVVTGAMLKLLEGFHQWAARRITWTTETREAGGEWEYTLVVAALESAGPHPIME